jgi:predicted DNA-binding ArsR family transcriptional regulator
MSAKLQNNTDNQSVKGKKIKGKTPELDAEKSQSEAPKEKTEEEIEAEKNLMKLKEIAENFIRVKDDYFKIVYRPDRSGKKYKCLLRLAKPTITDDHTKRILKHIKKYDDFCLVASHIDYRQEINGFFNQYSELTHTPKEGNCDTILHIIRHVFGTEYYEFALDYIQLLYMNPYQRLPIILMESEEKNTGKSTFGTLMYLIFQDNAIKIGNTDLESDFNGIWVQRSVIIVDETSLAKKGVTQMLKRFSTETGKVTINEKNKVKQEVDFIGKFLFFSNEEGKALPIERGDPRWAVFKIPTFKEKGYPEDPHIESKMSSEIPHFLHFIKNRKLVYSDESRMWFAPSVYQTPQLMMYYENSISKIAIAIKNLAKDTFAVFQEEEEIKFSLTNIMDELKENVRNLERDKVREALEKELKIIPNSKNAYTYFSLAIADRQESYYPPTNKGGNNITYSFFKKDYEV